MPYYCTVPRCTSMAGKAKNVSFHQFPRDEELAKLWNDILKRGKPYTKYSKVCSLHFRPEDYTITSVGKNKGQWRTLRKDAIPSQNLPSDTPPPYHRRQSGSWSQNHAPAIDPQVQHQIAQAIYMQTMLAMQAAGAAEPMNLNCSQSTSEEEPPDIAPHTSSDTRPDTEPRPDVRSFKCDQCSKCFKDPDVFLIHKRIHKPEAKGEKENFNINIKQGMLKSNPILANLLKNGERNNIFDNNLFEKQLMVSLASNMETYMRNISMINDTIDEDRDCDLNESIESNLVIDESV